MFFSAQLSIDLFCGRPGLMVVSSRVSRRDDDEGKMEG
jgi:hypothetical protein